MRILDENGIEIESPDLEKGYLKEDSLFIMHHEAVEAVEEQGHWETIAEYPNGGKDVDWIIDVEAVEAAEAWDEYEDILRYILYTEEELAEREAAKKEAQEKQERMNALLASGVTWDELAAAIAEGVNSI